MMKKRKINYRFFSLIVSAGLLFSGLQSVAAESDVIESVTANGLEFTITRSNADAATKVNYRTLDGSALGGVHYEAQSGTLDFAAGETQKTVSVSSIIPTGIFAYGNADREFSLVAWNDFSSQSAKAVVKNKVKSISLDEREYLIVDLLYATSDNERFAFGEDMRQNESLFKKEYSYYTAISQAFNYEFYIDARGQKQYAGYNHVTICYNDNENSRIVRYNIDVNDGNEHDFFFPNVSGPNRKPREYDRLSSIDYWDFYTADAEEQGYYIVDSSVYSLGVRLAADRYNKKNNGQFYLKNVTAHIRIYDYIAPTVKSLNINTASAYNVGDQMTIAVVFDELVYADNVTKAVTNRGEFAYAGGSGTNVLYFKGTANADESVEGVTLTSIDGSVADLGGNKCESFNVENTEVKINVPAPQANQQGFYEIYNVSQLVWFRNTINGASNDDSRKAKAILMADIDMSSACINGWTPINNFLGTFDGNNHSISGLAISGNKDNAGLFGEVGNAANKAVIRNLTVAGNVEGQDNVGGLAGHIVNAEITGCKTDVTVKGRTCVGGLAGKVEDATMANVEVNGLVTGKQKHVGGVCGYAENVAIDNAVNNSDVVFDAQGTTEVDALCGGICGEIKAGSVKNSKNYGNVGYSVEYFYQAMQAGQAASIKHVGGIAGMVNAGVTIDKCSNISTAGKNMMAGEDGTVQSETFVMATDLAGGIAGENNGIISNSTNNCTISSLSGTVGGIVGKNNGKINSCSNTGMVDGMEVAGGICGEAGSESVIEKCFNNAEIVSEGMAGGIAGSNAGTVSICYSENGSYVDGGECVGGVVGDNTGKIENCYNNGTVVGDDSKVGGIAGSNSGSIKNCFNNGTVTGDNYVGAICGDNSDAGKVNTTNCYYLVNSAKDGNTTAQYGNGNASPGSYTADVAGCTTSATTTDIENGTVCYNLNNKSVENVIWLQTLGEGSYPCFKGAKVIVETGGGLANPGLEKIELGNGKPNKYIYYQGEKLDLTGVTLIETYNDASTVTIDAQDAYESGRLTVTGFNSDNVGQLTVKVNYREKDFELSKFIVNQLRIDEMSVITDFKNKYDVKESLDAKDGEIQVKYNSGMTEIVKTDYADVTVTGFDSSKGGTVALAIAYKPSWSSSFNPELQPKSIQYNVEIVKKAVSLAFEDAKTIYVVGDEFGYEFGHIVVTYNDGTQGNVPFKDADVTNFSSSDEGTVYVMVDYEGQIETLEIQVVGEKTVKEMAVSNQRTTYYVGDVFDFAAGSVSVTYNNLSTETLTLDNVNVKVSGFSSLKAVESQQISVEYMDTVRTYQIEVRSVALESISVDSAKIDYQINTSLDKTVGKLLLIYNNGDEAELPLSNSKIMFDGYDPTKLAANQEITVVYGGLYTSYYVNIVCNHSDTIVEKADIVLPSCTVSGSHTEIFKCDICKSELNRISVVDSALGHKPAEAVKENVVVNGNKSSYDMVVYCSVDSVELHRHTFESVENVVKDTVFNTVTKTETVTKTVVETVHDTIYITDTIYVTDTVYVNDGDDAITINRAKVEMNAYPNPVQHTLYVNFDEYVDVEMFNAQGSMVYKSQFSTDSHTISVVDFPEGTYVVKASNGSTCRVIVQ